MLLNLLKNALLSCRSATKFVVKSKFVTPTAERKMKEATLREQTIQLIIPTNWTLFRDSINEQDKCHLFGERQTLTHLFVTCSEAHYFGLSLLIGGTPKTEIRSLSIKITVGTSNLVPRAQGPFGQHQDTELWNNQESRSQSPRGNWLFQNFVSWCWPKGTWALRTRLGHVAGQRSN